MKIYVEQCWHGGDKHSFRLTLPCGSRTSISGDSWGIRERRAALEELEQCYGLPRGNIRFKLH